MHKVIFKKIKIQNFLSVGEDTVELKYSPGLNIITGANLDKEDSGNGIGKSTILEAIYFALFGDTLRELKADQIKHYGAKGKCEVTVYFDIANSDGIKSYKIIRNSKPSKVKISEDKHDITPSTIVKTNEFVKNLIRSTPEVFHNSVIMTANNAIPFMSQKKVDKRKFLEGILGLGVFGEMLGIARQQYNDAKQQYTIENTKFQTQQNALKRQKDQFEAYTSKKKERYDNINERIDQHTQEVKQIEDNIKELTQDLKDIKVTVTPTKLDTAINKQQEKLNDVLHNVGKLSHEKEWRLTTLEDLLTEPDVCITCSRPLTQKLKKEAVQKQRQLQKEIDKIVTDLEAHNDSKGEIEIKVTKLKAAKTVIVKTEHQISSINNTIDNNTSHKTRILNAIENLQSDIKNLDSDDKLYMTGIKEVENLIKEIRQTLNEHNRKLDTLKVVKFVVSEEGIRSFVVKKILKVMNNRLAYYLKKLDANCTCVFNEYFMETLVDEKGRECSYFNFSSGERKRIDLAILFTFQDLRRLQSDVTLNISMYDELLDSSLDSQGTKKVLEILNDRAEQYDECIYIVTHRPDAVDIVTGEIIYLEKENGVTRIAEHCC